MKLMPQMLLGLVILAAIAGGVLLLVRSSSDGGVEIVLPKPTATPVVELKAYISGAVRNPGVYDVNEGDRLVHLVEAAGGVTDVADLSAVNLAAKVRDEDHWHIPRPGEKVAAGSPASPSAQRSLSESGRIDINTADVRELTNLPGIGEIIAQRIIDYRDANGPFSNVEDLLAVRGIGPNILAGIRDRVEVR